MKKRNLSEVVELINKANIEGVVKAKKIFGLTSDGEAGEYLSIEFEEDASDEAIDKINEYLKSLKEEEAK